MCSISTQSLEFLLNLMTYTAAQLHGTELTCDSSDEHGESDSRVNEEVRDGQVE